MTTYWDKTALVRAGLDATSTATSLGFTAARLGTRLGFSATRGIANVAGTAVDHTFFGGRTGAPGTTLSGTVVSALTLTERIALLPLALGEGLTCGALGAAQALLPDADGALAAFVALVRRERSDPVLKERLPPGAGTLGVTETTRALAAWAVLQALTADCKEREWLRHTREIGVVDAGAPRMGSRSNPPLATGRRMRRRALSLQTDDERKMTVRRLGKLVLAGVLGPPKMTGVVGSLQAEADSTDPAPTSAAWYDVLLGRPDAGVGAAVGAPRFWVLTDRARREVIVVIRGILSLDALACASASFRPARTDEADTAGMPGYARFETKEDAGPAYTVHEGILRMTRSMGEQGKPLHTAVRDVLRKHPAYDLVLCGHSLGAGVATLLGLTWADPATCRTVATSGLPAGRRIAVYAFAPPCTCDATLGTAAREMVTSVVCGLDAVARLSLGSVRDMTRAAAWLCAEGTGGVLTRAARHRAGLGKANDAEWFLAMRKTLEANMHLAELFPPGRVWWALRDDALHPSNRRTGAPAVRLFEVHDVEKVFGQVVLAGDMLSSHLPHRYDAVISELS